MGRWEEAISAGEKAVMLSAGSPKMGAALAQTPGAAGKPEGKPKRKKEAAMRIYDLLTYQKLTAGIY